MFLRILIMAERERIVHALTGFEREITRAAVIQFSVDPNPSLMAINNSFADGQSDPSAGKLLTSMQTLKNDKDPLSLIHVDADAVILHRKQEFAVLLGRIDFYSRRTRIAIFYGIRNQVLK